MADLYVKVIDNGESPGYFDKDHQLTLDKIYKVLESFEDSHGLYFVILNDLNNEVSYRYHRFEVINYEEKFKSIINE